MATASELAVLMALRVRGRADAAQVARSVGCGTVSAEAVLAALAAQGAAAPVAPRPGAAGAPEHPMVLSDAGRVLLSRLVADEPIDRGALARGFDERFPSVDRALKEAITAWQLAAERDKSRAQEAVMARAAEAGGVASAIAEVAPRFAPYPLRIA